MVRVSVPDKIVRMTSYGLRQVPDELRSDLGWWRRVVDEMQEFVRAHLPPGATGVEMSLDSARIEVVLSYVLLPAAGPAIAP